VTDVVWSPEALRDLEAIRDYIARGSAAYADLVVRRIVAAVERLRTFPESGRVVPGRTDPSIREVIVWPYRVVHRLHDGTVQIVTVLRASRLFTLPTED